jgi:hypothetical protein
MLSKGGRELMAGTEKKTKVVYQTKVKEYEGILKKLIAQEKEMAGGITKGDQAFDSQRLILTDRQLDLVSYYLLMNSFSAELLGVKNDSFLNEARKCCYQAIIYLEEVVSPIIDAPFSDYEDKLLSLVEVDDRKRFDLVKKLGFSIDSVKNGFGENSKWKWSFIEVEARFSVVAKNLIDLKLFISKLDPRVEGYQDRVAHMQLVKRLLQKAADGYREKYELSTRRIDDMQMAIRHLAALRRIHAVMGESELADVAKKRIDVWKTKMEMDSRGKKKS